MSRVTQEYACHVLTSHTGLSPSAVRLSRRFRSSSHGIAAFLQPRPCPKTAAVWALPRSLATTGGIIALFSLPRGTKMFQFPRLASHPMIRCPPFERTGCPIRKSAGHRPFAPYRGLSQLITSFIASVSQGIRPAPLFTFSFTPSTEGRRGSYFQLFCGTTCAWSAICAGVFLTTVLLVQYVKDLHDSFLIYIIRCASGGE